jgi:hypothetical protein
MTNTFVTLFLLALLAPLSSTIAEPPALGDIARIRIEAVNPWSHLDFHNDEANFQFAIVTDRTGGHRGTVFEDGLAKVNLLEPEFVMSVGDLIEGYSHDPRRWHLSGMNSKPSSIGSTCPSFTFLATTTLTMR